MPIRVSCPACGKTINAPDKAAGKTGKCPNCGQAVAIPAQPPTTLPPAPGSTPKAAPVEKFDVDIEDDFDVEFDNSLPPPVLPSTTAPVLPVQPVQPMQPVQPVGVPANPFATFGPPPDSAASMMNLDDPADDPPPGDALHPGWKDVNSGVQFLGRSILVSLTGFIALDFAIAYVSFKGVTEVIFTVAMIVGLLIWSVALVFFAMGLWKCMKAPEEREGGPGKGLALWTFIVAMVGPPLAPCGVGVLVLLAIPFLIGSFFRKLGQALPSPVISAAAMRFMVTTGVCLFLMALFAALPLISSIVLVRMRVSFNVIHGTNICYVVVAALIQLTNLAMFSLTCNTISAEITKAIKLRKLRKVEETAPKSRRR